MSSTAALQRLAGRLALLEQELHAVRRELSEALGQVEESPQASLVRPPTDFAWANTEALRRHFEELFRIFSIQAEPVGALELQRMMAEAGLGPNELSSSLVGARED